MRLVVIKLFARDYREERRFTLGKIEGRLFAVAYTARDT